MFHYISCGLPNVYLNNGYNVINTEDGQATSIVDVEGLHDAIAFTIIRNSPHLKPEEVRFLRKEIGMSQHVLGEMLGVSEQTVSLWERGNSPIPKSSDVLLRGFYIEGKTSKPELLEIAARLSELQQEITELEDKESKLAFEVNEGWHELPLAA